MVDKFDECLIVLIINTEVIIVSNKLVFAYNIVTDSYKI